MQGWLNTGGASSEEHKSKRVKQTLSGPDLMALLTVLMKITLSNAQRLRVLEGCLYRTFLLKESNPIAVTCVQAHTNYKSRVKDNPTHGLGTPAAHVWGAVIQSCIGVATGGDKDTLQAYFQGCADPVELSTRIFFARIGGCFEKGMMKLQFYISSELESIFALVHKLLTSNGADYKPGSAPMSGLERELQKRFDQLCA